MNDGHLTVPGSSDSSDPPDNNNYFTGRPRSGSQRSQRSRRSSGGLPVPENTDYTRRPSIRLRGFSGIQDTITAQNAANTGANAAVLPQNVAGGVSRNRSLSAPQRPGDVLITRTGPVTTTTVTSGMTTSTTTTLTPMPGVAEEVGARTQEPTWEAITPAPTAQSSAATNPAAVSSWRPLRRAKTNIAAKDFANGGDEYESNLVDFLDTIDPEVQTLNSLNNVQNSLFVPNLGRYLNRRPTYTLTRRPSDIEEDRATFGPDETEAKTEEPSRLQAQRVQSNATLTTINSRVNDKFYAVLPHGVTLPGWSEEDKLELNDHVRHMLHSRRSKFKRSMKGFGQYVRKPLGFFVTLYATLITLFGLAWVLFLIGWVNVGGRQLYIINVIDNILVALFAIMGDGLAPFRTVDTYHMIFIAHYHFLTWRLRRERKLPELHDHNDLPPLPADGEAINPEKEELSVLTEAQQKKLAHHQKKFSRSHSFYKPHETVTHHAFPLKLLITIVVLLDCHSLLQISLGACTWGIYYKNRPFALTTVILCCSITCNITAGVLILVGDKKTRKKDVLERMERQELTKHAMKKVEKRRERESMDLIREQSERASMDITRGEGNGKGNTSGNGMRPPEIRVSSGRSGGVLESVRDEHEH